MLINIFIIRAIKSIFYLIIILSASKIYAEKFFPSSMLYILQADKLAKTSDKAVKQIAKCGRDFIVIDYSFQGSPDWKWTHTQIKKIKQGKQSRKVVSYISIGEAEEYRFYWRDSWDRDKDGMPDKNAPDFLEPVNPDWEGNYKVKYWHKNWQVIILKYIEQIIEQGFDGIYLDIVDAFEYYEYDAKKDDWIDNRKNPETGNTYREDMINWVKIVAGHAREKKASFLVIPQNGVQLLEQRSYIDIIDGIGVESLFSSGKKLRKAKEVNYNLDYIKHIIEAGKPVFLIEYLKKQDMKKKVIKKAKKYPFILLFTEKQLKKMCETLNIGKEKSKK